MQSPARRKKLIKTLSRLRAQREQERDRLRILLMGVERELDEIEELITRDNQSLDRFVGMIGKRRILLRGQADTLRESIKALSLDLKREERWIDTIEDDRRRTEQIGEQQARDEDLAGRISKSEF
ncbi:hypothetical protein [Notoacmeibacter sp. MSK16QG-6]|uniref:hypothetical protein n=1 Tax=Notoacmeibacter sp. MSK16QG-6 TaxID=2957982 RepID=UPI00209C8F0C|nr:hypothetical protein [Notoacmeibacter sp. MSK16QG-6]MCP1200886.1 hypothetical protein [Notoacmeibacter sp. MSK16QG-6]